MDQYLVTSFVSHISKQNVRTIVDQLSGIIGLDQESARFEHIEDEEVRKELVEIVTNEANTLALYTSFSQYEREVLEYFIFQIGQDLLTYRQIEQGELGIKPNLFRLGLTGLRRKGIIYTVRRQWGEVAYVLPADLERLFYSVILQEQGIEDIDTCQEPVILYHENPSPLWNDLFFVVDDIRKQPGMALGLTQKGAIHKRFIRSWQERWPDRESAMESCTLAFEHRETYTKHVALLLDFLTYYGLLRWYKGKVKLDLSKTNQWMSQSRDHMTTQFLEYWFSVYSPSTRWLERYFKDMFVLATQPNGDKKLLSGEWVYVLTFLEYWEERYQLPSIDQVKEQVKKELLLPLAAMGFLELARTQNGEEVWRWKDYEENEGPIYLQPTMELYCPGILPFSLLWELTKIFAFEKWENMLILSPSKEKVKATIERGDCLQKWISWLRERSIIPIPASFEEQLFQWENKQQQVFIADMTVVDIGDEGLAKAFIQWPEVEEYNVRRVNSSLFLIPLQYKEEIIQILSMKGIQVGLHEKAGEENEELVRDAHLILNRKQQLSPLKVENVVPDMTEAIPSWSRLPDMWKKQFHTYHEKTKCEIVEQAIQHQLQVKIEDASGHVFIISPTSCQVEQGNWICYDQNRVKHRIAQVNRMQLLFPDTSSS